MKAVIDPALVRQAVRDVERTHVGFDTHDVINRFIALYPVEYEAALQALHNKESAVHALHSELGRVIAEVCRQMGFEDQPSRSPDIHGQSSKCLRWRRAQSTQDA